MKPSCTDIAEATQTLQNNGWLSRTAPDFRDAMLAHAQWQRFESGETVSHGGDTSGGMFGLARGALTAIPAVGPPDTPAIHVCTAPYWFGSNPLNSNLPRSVSMIARTPGIVARLPQQALATMLAEHPHWWKWISLGVSEIFMLVSQIATDLLIRDSRRRCIAVLLRLADRRAHGDAAVVMEIGQDELAAMANMSRQTGGPILHALAAAGLVTAGYRNITVHDPAALRAIVDG